MCIVDLTNGEYILEVYDTTLDDYIVLTERYLMEFRKRLSTTTIQRLQGRLEPFQWEEELTPALTEYRSYVVVWLDEHIGRPQEYSSLKRMFNSMVDVDGASWSIIWDKCDIENLIRLEREPARTTIQFFDKSDDCLTFIYENAGSTAIFLVTSSHFGRIIAPIVADQVYAIYVLCISIEVNMDWALDYVEFIQMFNFDIDLLERLIRDIAYYFVERGKALMEDNDQRKAFKSWSNARKLLLRVNVTGKRYFNKDIVYFNTDLDYIDHMLNTLSLSDNRTESLECEEA